MSNLRRNPEAVADLIDRAIAEIREHPELTAFTLNQLANVARDIRTPPVMHPMTRRSDNESRQEG